MSSMQDNPWDLPGAVDYFKINRKSMNQLYKSELFFLKDYLKEGISILDIGCALGGFANVCSERITDFDYTGVDISKNMILKAREIHPSHQFYHINEADLSPVFGKKFDLVLCLGILHLSSKWRELLIEAWNVTNGCFIFDLRETNKPSIENIEKSYFKMDFNYTDTLHSETKIPYIILNTSDALNYIVKNLVGYKTLSQFGYMHSVSASAVTPIQETMMNTYCIEK